MPLFHGNPYQADCPTRGLLDRIGDRWTVLIIGILGERDARFSELRREIEGISQKMLTQTLRQLERDGLVLRTVYPEVPVRVVYRSHMQAVRFSSRSGPFSNGPSNTWGMCPRRKKITIVCTSGASQFCLMAWSATRPWVTFSKGGICGRDLGRGFQVIVVDLNVFLDFADQVRY